MPKISVVIPTLNEEKYLATCLESLSQQTFTDFEIIISDGGSTDNTLDLAKRYTKNIFIHHNSNVCQARDLGLRKAAGAIIVCADADTIYPKNHLEVIWQEFQKHKDAVAVTGTARIINGPKWGIIIWNVIYAVLKTVYKLTGTVLYAPAYNLSYKKDILLKLGGYNINLDFGGDELDVLRRLKTQGKIIFSNQLMPQTSGRRYKVGFFIFLFKHALYYYSLNYLSGKIFGKSLIRAKPVR